MPRDWKTGLLLALLFFSASAVLAHHSPAGFDMQQRVEVRGAVKAFQWTNPHAYIQLLVKDDKGRQEEWSLEMSAPFYLQRHGWRPDSLKPGDNIVVTIAPLRSVKKGKGGLVISTTMADGKPIGRSAEKAP